MLKLSQPHILHLADFPAMLDYRRDCLLLYRWPSTPPSMATFPARHNVPCLDDMAFCHHSMAFMGFPNSDMNLGGCRPDPYGQISIPMGKIANLGQNGRFLAVPILSQAFHLPKSGARKGHAALCAGWGMSRLGHLHKAQGS